MAQRVMFRAIRGYSGRYTINNFGQIFSVITKKYLVATPNPHYLTVMLSKNGETTRHYIHRLVALTFLPNPKKLPEVNHINGDKLDNSLFNLEWVSRSRNKLHSRAMRGARRVGAYKGVGSSWVSYLIHNRKKIWAGSYLTKEDAHMGYYWKYLELHGEPPWLEKTPYTPIRLDRGDQVLVRPRKQAPARYRKDRDVWHSRLKLNGKEIFVKQSKDRKVCVEAFVTTHRNLFGCDPIMDKKEWASISLKPEGRGYG